MMYEVATGIALSRTSLFLLDDVKESAPEPVGLENWGKLCYCTRSIQLHKLKKRGLLSCPSKGPVKV